MRLGSTFVQSTIKHRDHLYFFKKLSNFRPHIAFFSGLSKCSSCSWPKKGSRSSEQIRDERLCMEPAITDGCKSSTKHDKKSQFNGALFQLKNCIESLKTFLEIVRNIRWFPMPIASQLIFDLMIRKLSVFLRNPSIKLLQRIIQRNFMKAKFYLRIIWASSTPNDGRELEVIDGERYLMTIAK